MTNLLLDLHPVFSSGSFMPHGHCYLWKPSLVWLHLGSDLVTTCAYFLVAGAIIYFTRNHQALTPKITTFLVGMFFVFLGCGLTHLSDVITLWYPLYWHSGFIKLANAVCSAYVFTCLLVPLIPVALDAPNPEELELANAALKKEIAERERIEAALRESEYRYYTLAKSSPVGIFRMDLAGSCLYINEQGCQITGLSLEECLGQGWTHVVHPEDRERTLKARQDSLQQQLPFYSEYRLQHPDGRVVWVVAQGVLEKDKDGQALGYIATLTDITERKHAEEALRQERNFVSAILESAGALVVVLDTEGRIVRFNRTCEQTTGYSFAEVQNQHLWNLFLVPEEMRPVRAVFEQLKASQLAGEYENHWLTKTGDRRLIAWSNRVLTEADGSVKYVIGTGLDVTERRQVEIALRDSEAKFRAMSEATPIPVLISRLPDGMILYANQPLNSTFGFTEELTHRTTPDLYYEQADRDNLLAELFHQGYLYDYEVRAKRADGSPFWISLSAQVLNFDGYEAVLAVFYDITERKHAIALSQEKIRLETEVIERRRAETEIRKALEKEKELNELKSRFVSMVSHEFRTPLATILLSAELLEEFSHKWTEEKKRLHMQRIQIAVKHMVQLLEDILLIGKAEAGKVECNPAPLDLIQFCHDLVEELQLSIGAKHTILFQALCPPGRNHGLLTNVLLDEKLLRPILNNLLSNAIKYSPSGTTIQFEIAREAEEIIFHVQDQGIGIPVADQAHLFDTFQRGSNVGNISGTGLGLAIVKKSVDLHGGKLSVSSEVGVGTTFMVKLPYVASIASKSCPEQFKT